MSSKGETVIRKRLGEVFGVKDMEIEDALSKLKEMRGGEGVVLLDDGEKVSLGTAPELSDFFEKLQKEELNKELSKASLETLSIILYKNGASRPEIDYIRGVNSSFTLRALSIRGLIERINDPKDQRRYLYRPSFELLSYMGIRSVEELPDYTEVRSSIEISAKNLAEELKKEETNT